MVDSELRIGRHPAIVGIGSVLGKECVTNDQLIKKTGMDSSDEKIQELTGIRQRHFAGDVPPSALGTTAADRAMRSAGISVEQVSGIYASKITGEVTSPDTAVLIHDKLGLRRNSLAVDMGGACAGSVITLNSAANRTRETGEPTLSVGLGKMTPITNFDDRRSGILFGDGAGAFVVANKDDTLAPAFEFFTVPDPKAIYVPGDGDRQPWQNDEDPYGKIAMQGKIVGGHAVDLMPEAARAAAQRAGIFDYHRDRIDWKQVAAVVPHQANGNLIKKVGKALHVPKEKVVVTVGDHGNTSAASIPLAFDRAHQEGMFDSPGRQIVLFTAIGAGMEAGAGVMEVKIPPQRT